MTTTAKRRQGTAKPDPIFAAIEAHKAALKKWLAINDLLAKKQDAAAKKIGQRPIELIVWRDYYIGDSEIPYRKKEFLRQRVASPKLIKAEYLDAMERYRKQCRRASIWDKRGGIAKLRKQLAQAIAAEHDLGKGFAKLKPTTAAGVGAAITYILADADDGNLEDWHRAALETAAVALKTMG
jgi:hypothetical protein